MMELKSSAFVYGSSQKTEIPDNPKWLTMICTKCSSENTKMINISYPVTHECKSCGNIFVESKRSLIDE